MGQLATSPVGQAEIRAFESCLKKIGPGQFTTYRCPANVLTIGWGTTRDDVPDLQPGDVWSQVKCDEVFRVSLTKYERHVLSLVGNRQLTQYQFDALVSWAYNCGGPASSSVWKAIREGRDKEVPERLARWNKADGKVLKGLVRRRKAEGQLWSGDIDGALATAQASVGVPMPQSRETPTPTVPELIRKTPAAAATVTAAAGTSGGTGTTTVAKGSASGAEIAAIVVGAAILVAAGVLMLRRWRTLAEDWA